MLKIILQLNSFRIKIRVNTVGTFELIILNTPILSYQINIVILVEIYLPNNFWY